MPMTGKRRKITAAVVVFFVLFSALFLSVRPENSGYAAGSPATSCTWQSERFSVTEHVNVEELSGCGVDGVAVVSAIFAAEDPGAATEHLKTLAAEMVSHE